MFTPFHLCTKVEYYTQKKGLSIGAIVSAISLLRKSEIFLFNKYSILL